MDHLWIISQGFTCCFDINTQNINWTLNYNYKRQKKLSVKQAGERSNAYKQKKNARYHIISSWSNTSGAKETIVQASVEITVIPYMTAYCIQELLQF